jgi:L-alanine-DL-glutamate epimerase-like enolase superfamily enzyme
MKITEVETIQLGEFPNLLYLRLHTDEGLVGLGETFGGPAGVAAWLHETAARIILGRDPLAIEGLWRALNPVVGYSGTGVESRGRSAVDFALWDILAQSANLPLYQLIGGATRERSRIYNTCAGYGYVRKIVEPTRLTSNWNIGLDSDARPGPYEDLDAFMHRADELAESLLDEGITCMKIWPLDPLAESTGGRLLSRADLHRALEPLRMIRDAVGDRMDVMLEMHSVWDLPSARVIADAADELTPFWYEDPVKLDDLGALGEFAESTSVPVAAGENLGTRWSFRELLERRAAGVVIFDPAYVGGISESRKIAAMAEAYQRPVATHDCNGPVAFTVDVHLSTSLPNAMIQEFVRAYYSSWYRDLVTELPRVEKGYVYPLTGSGLGTALQPSVPRRPDAIRRTTGPDDV